MFEPVFLLVQFPPISRQAKQSRALGAPWPGIRNSRPGSTLHRWSGGRAFEEGNPMSGRTLVGPFFSSGVGFFPAVSYTPSVEPWRWTIPLPPIDTTALVCRVMSHGQCGMIEQSHDVMARGKINHGTL